MTQASIPLPTRRLALSFVPPKPSLAGGLLLTVGGLSILGLTMVLSASSVTSLTQTGSPWGEFVSQGVWLALGVVVLGIASVVDLNWIRKLTPLALAVSTILLVLVRFGPLGVSVNGAQRWIQISVLQFQPSEVAKLAVLSYLATVLAKSQTVDLRRYGPPIGVVLSLTSALILIQPNLGTTVILFVMSLSVLHASGIPMRIVIALGSLCSAAALGLAYVAPYRRARLLSFIDPWEDPLGNGYQTIQSQVSVANGGLDGVGIGASRGKYGFLPEAHNDFIFAVTAEELGLIGAVGVVSGFVLFGIFGLIAAHRADRFEGLLAVGVVTWLSLQAFINIGAVLGMLPITGVPLPFLSAGGTALVVNLAAAGIVINVARKPAKRTRRAAVSTRRRTR